MKMLAALFVILLSFIFSACPNYSGDSRGEIPPGDEIPPLIITIPPWEGAEDVFFQYQDYLNQINILPAWSKTKGAGVKVMVFDDGVQSSHEELTNISVWNVKNGSSSAEPTDMKAYSHGTEISGLIAARENGKGIIGVAPECNYLFIGDSSASYSDADVIKAFEYAKNQGVKVISCSWGSYNVSSTFESLVEDCYNAGIAMFFASGNENLNMDIVSKYGNINDESESPWIIGVSSSNADGNRAWFSNYGGNIDIMAPGEHILTLDLMGNDGENNGYPANNNYNHAEGTSYSTPIAAGVAALMLSTNPALTPFDIREILTETAAKSNGGYDSDGFSLQKAYGQIDAGAAVEKAAELRSQ